MPIDHFDCLWDCHCQIFFTLTDLLNIIEAVVDGVTGLTISVPLFKAYCPDEALLGLSVPIILVLIHAVYINVVST